MLVVPSEKLERQPILEPSLIGRETLLSPQHIAKLEVKVTLQQRNADKVAKVANLTDRSSM